MKSIILIVFSLILSVTCFGQTLFFDNLNNSAWGSTCDITDSALRDSKEIQLRRLNFPKDSLKANVAIWNFKDGLLTIVYSNHLFKADKIVATYQYEANTDKGILKITLDDKKTMEFSVGTVLTGNFALLMKKKVKNKKL
ncbi:MAG: hypothetical protein ACKODM_00635 [Cytophagales bacterium]